MVKRKSILLTLLIFGFATISFGNDVFKGMKVDQTLDVKEKVYLMKDLLAKTGDLFATRDSGKHEVIEYNYQLLFDSLNEKSLIGLYPIVHVAFEDLYNQEAFFNALSNEDNPLAIRKLLIENYSMTEAYLFNDALMLRFINQFGQQTEVEMMSPLFREGKIYVVLGVVLIIFTVLIGMLFRLNGRMNQLEKEVES